MWKTISHSTSHNWLELKAKKKHNDTALSFGRNTASNTSISCGVFRDENLSLFQTWLCWHHQSIKATVCQSDNNLFHVIYLQLTNVSNIFCMECSALQKYSHPS